ncbi:MAG TPA: alpha/beta hydrolase [Baekduia sp.]|uniref:alpha/beta fold hydrolase n=1 Tax=Baekduia sp. TaxID=2600305 RepID=UPI002C2C00F7|nr:alpha/beta hydrolase [Baekduia sp.]HMJ33971.1 alpha/beta hydrolase [Baekduia sp.]
MFPPSRRVPTNGIELAVHEQGEGPAVLLLHGFPELAYSWRNQIGPIADAGFRVIVPDQRGYGDSDAPADSQSYSVKNLVADATGVLDALGIEQAIFIGHDWGSMPAWYSGVYAPDRVRAVASLCTPYFTPGDADLLAIYHELRGPKHYMATFQEPGVGEALLERDVEATFRALLRGRGYTMDEFEAAPAEVREVPAGVFVGDPQLFGDELLSDAELAVYADTYRRTGFTGGLNWYRALHKDWEEGLGHEFVIDKPALMISAADDWFFPRGATDGMEELLPQVRKHVIPDAGHWLQQERPDDVNALLLDWLKDLR